ncbi:MAG: Cell surface glycoprotein [Candidatus Methanophagaceae archaeon]|nr:MAG: Cell surface glycoprotein [Methanophagales archaeon]KAF5416456.1 MAG: Cell surface glycoprotein [Methanophagales archaeon]
MKQLKLAAGSSRAYAKPRMQTRPRMGKTVSCVLLLVIATVLLFALAPASTTTVIPDSQLVIGNVTTICPDEIQAGNTTIYAELINPDLNSVTAYSRDGLTGTEIKQKIQEFVAAPEEPVNADEIVSFVNGNVMGAGESSFSPRPKQAAFNGICDFYVNQSGWWPGGGCFNLSNTQIQHAIDNATAGDTICVYNGSYIEDVNVDKTLTLAGEGAAVVTVTAKSTDDHVFNVTVDLVNISGFNVTGATGTGKAGICLNRSQHCNITNNTAAGNYYGIRLDYSSSNNTLTSNTANANSNGILLYYSSNNNTLVNNTANSNNYNGIYLSISSNNTLTTTPRTRTATASSCIIRATTTRL